ncbi:MAG: 50S ribosomal protein L15 [Gloeomargaritaceae cyanobacterium C42_A2020_066]|nr:50S ribosomal protein L15 [Gloeomargaritaceae cyanobacterium C42_A2020_066]
MEIHSLKPQTGAKRRKRRIGRGISAGQGASGGFGMRGQKSRSGRGTRPGFEGGQNPLYRRLPKLKGFRPPQAKQFTILNVGRLQDWPADQPVTLVNLLVAKWVKQPEGPLKVLGDGELTQALTVEAAAFTASARHKIEAAGGTCIQVEGRPAASEAPVTASTAD